MDFPSKYHWLVQQVLCITLFNFTGFISSETSLQSDFQNPTSVTVEKLLSCIHSLNNY